MSRVQLALNVSDLEASVRFYTDLFGVAPHKRRPGYANFAVIDPPLKLVLIESTAEARGTGTASALNHLGVEVEDTAQVTAAGARLTGAGLKAREEANTTCCYAVQDKIWVTDPAGAPWEIYTITNDEPEDDPEAENAQFNGGGCCGSTSEGAPETAPLSAACC
jgi:catechol 2,3-dioxygenase-like lactoylglutathione lyase family enzyme